jgi:hypothetical protein
MGLFEQREREEQGWTKKAAACVTIIPICVRVVGSGSWAGWSSIHAEFIVFFITLYCTDLLQLVFS